MVQTMEASAYRETTGEGGESQNYSNPSEKKWSKKGSIKVIDISEEFFVNFRQEEDYKFDLLDGPWMFQDHYLILKRWRPFFECGGGEEIRKLAV